MSIVLAIIIGFLFGFVLQKVGAANPQKIIGMLKLKDFHLMKTIMLALGFSSLVLFSLLTLGLIDSGNFSVKSAYVGVMIGGAIFGLGWAIAGYCPGTALVGVGAGRKDAFAFIVGGLVGAFAFTLSYESLKATFLFDKLGGKVTLSATENVKYASFTPDMPSILIAGSIALIFIIIAWKLPKEITQKI